MRKRFKRETIAATRRSSRRAANEQAELALLAEFMRHNSVASLAGAIAARLGGNVRETDLIARADLELETRQGLPPGHREWELAPAQALIAGVFQQIPSVRADDHDDRRLSIRHAKPSLLSGDDGGRARGEIAEHLL